MVDIYEGRASVDLSTPLVGALCVGQTYRDRRGVTFLLTGKCLCCRTRFVGHSITVEKGEGGMPLKTALSWKDRGESTVLAYPSFLDLVEHA